MSDIINLSLKSIKLPASKTLQSTSYQVSNTGQFINADDIIYENLDDETNLYEIDIDLDFSNTDVFYGRVKLNFDDGSFYGWTKPIILTKNGDDFSHNNTVIVTPSVELSCSVSNAELGGFKINGSKFVVFTGSGNHKYTTWSIKDSSGSTVWERKRDKNNLTAIRVPNNTLTPNRVYSVEVQYISNNNMVSNFGKLTIKTSGDAVRVDDLKYGSIKPVMEENRDLKVTVDILLAQIINQEC